MKKTIVLALGITVLALMVSPVFAQGLIRIEPNGSYYGQPIMLKSPATFNVFVQSGDNATDPHIFSVMTKSCYDSLKGEVTVNWTNAATPDLTITTWHEETENSVKVPSEATNGASYTVASLKSHLNTSEPIYWAFEPFLDEDISETPTEFTVTLQSDDSRMLVYALGKSPGEQLFDNRVPPTLPGFVVPEPAVLLLAIASFSAFALYAIKRRKSDLRTIHQN